MIFEVQKSERPVTVNRESSWAGPAEFHHLMKKKKHQFWLYFFISIVVVFLFALRLSPITKVFPSFAACISKPTFEDYPVPPGDWYLNSPAPVRFIGTNLDTAYQSMIRKSVARGVNFAGQYVVVERGCGVSCQSHAIIDAKTGKILSTGLESSYGAEFRKNSTLLIINPKKDTWDGLKKSITAETAYYTIKKGKIVPVCN